MWSGEVTNDTLAPLRSRLAGGLRRGGSGARSRRRPDLRAVSRTGPPAAAGRWSLTSPLFAGAPTPTEAATARALQLLHRYGVLTREMALAEGIQGGFAGVYPLLKVLEERGQLRRGYFVEGLGAAQFAQPGAVDRLRAEGRGDPSERSAGSPQADRLPWEPKPEPEEQADTWVLAATDPAQPFGASLSWPDSTGQPSRSAGAYVVLTGGEPAAYVERGGRSLFTFAAARGRRVGRGTRSACAIRTGSSSSNRADRRWTGRGVATFQVAERRRIRRWVQGSDAGLRVNHELDTCPVPGSSTFRDHRSDRTADRE